MINLNEQKIIFFENKKTVYGNSVTLNDYIECVKNSGYKPKEERTYFFTSFQTDKNRARKVDLLQSNGLLYIDIDSKDNPGKTALEIKKELTNLHFAYIINLSQSKKGVHCLIAFQKPNKEVITEDDYKAAYRQLYVLFKDTFNIIIDKKAGNPTQKICTGNDPDIYINPDVQPFIYTYSEETDEEAFKYFYKKKPNEKEYELNNLNDGLLYAKFHTHFHSYKTNINFIITDNTSNEPIPFSDDFKFNPEQHSLNNSFSKDYIGRQKFTNKDKSLAYIPDGVVAYQFILLKNSLKRGTRQRVIIGFVLAWYHLNKAFLMDDWKKNIYNFTLMLSKEAVQEQLSKFELNSILYSLFSIIEKNEEPKYKFKCRKSITINKKEFYRNKPESTSCIKWTMQQIYAAKKTYKMNQLKQLIRSCTHYTEAVNQIAKNKNCSIRHAKYIMKVYKKEQGVNNRNDIYKHTLSIPFSHVEFSNIHLPKLSEKINFYEQKGITPTQDQLAKDLGISMKSVQIILKENNLKHKTTKIDQLKNQLRLYPTITQKDACLIVGCSIDLAKRNWRKIKSEIEKEKAEKKELLSESV